MQPNNLYEQDEHAWIEQQIALMRAGKMEQLDGHNLVLFLSDMMIRDRRELRSRITELLVYLLKIQYLSEPVTRRLISSITEQQQEINTLLESVPSLQQHVPGLFDAAYRSAVGRAKAENGSRRLPSPAPWTLQQVIEYEPPAEGARLPAPHVELKALKPKSIVPEGAIAKVLAGGRVGEVAREFGVRRQTLSDRVKRALTPLEDLPAAEPDPDPVDNANGEERGGCD